MCTRVRSERGPREARLEERAELAELTVTLRGELEIAQSRYDRLRTRREQLQRDLAGATAAEEAASQSVASLRAVAAHVSGLCDGRDANGDSESTHVALAGSELREAIARIALRRNAQGQEVHWRTWFGWLRDDGLDAAGKRAEATFQTQLARSPLVRRTQRDGVYVLDIALLEQHRDDVIALHRRLEELPPPGQLALMGDVRAQRRALQQEIARAERALEEAWRTLAEDPGHELSPDPPPDAEQVARVWRAGSM
jgi:hypothetical protein